ncbi:MAG: hypothetical protein KAR20_22020, partial [Candidatus Heimdallarchaeota archaeon]|nr:hypothetical protein [Candidatus Heimdallarchaeota archaeon]
MNYLPFKCKYCGLIYCKKHRLPENHSCAFTNQIRVSPSQTSEIPKTEDQDLEVNVNSVPSSLYSGPKDGDFDNQLDREMRDYIRRQERTSMPSPRTSRTSRRSSGHRVPFISRATKPTVTYWIMGITTFLSVVVMITGFHSTFMIYTPTLLNAFLLPLLTSGFTTGDPISLLFALFVLYGISKSIELQYGPKFMLAIYAAGAFLGTIGVIVIQGLGMIFEPTLSFLYVQSVPVSTLWAA